MYTYTIDRTWSWPVMSAAACLINILERILSITEGDFVMIEEDSLILFAEGDFVRMSLQSILL